MATQPKTIQQKQTFDATPANTAFLNLYEEIKRDLDEIRVNAFMEPRTKRQINIIKEKILRLEKEKIGAEFLDLRKERILEVKLILKDKFLLVSKRQLDEKKKKDDEIVKKIKIVSPDITEENLKKAIMNPQKYLDTKIITNGSDIAIFNAFSQVKETYEETKRLQEQIEELNRMIIDFADLVEKEGAVLDVIEGQVLNSVERVDQGNEQLGKAFDLKQQVCRKRICCACLCTTLIIIIAVAIFLGVFLTKTSIKI